MAVGVGPVRAVRSATPFRRDVSAETRAALDDTADRAAPTVLAGDRRLEVVPALEHVLPDGIQRGSTIGIRGQAPLSLGLVTAAGAVRAGAWMAMLGCDQLGLVAAEQAGVPLHRVVMVDQPQRSSWGAVAAALVDAFDVVLVSSSFPVKAKDGRRLLSRARERGGVIIDVSNTWPEATDLVLEVVDQRWTGLGEGYGVLEAREVTIEVSGRRGVRPRLVPMWLPGPDQVPQAIDPAHAGADIDHLVAVEADDDLAEVTPLRRVG